MGNRLNKLSIDEKKNLIRSFLKKEKKIESKMGTIELKGEIGQGGNAIVFKATFGMNTIALKILAEDVGSNSTKYKRFLTEFKEIVQLADTKAVVPIYYYDHLEIEGLTFPYIVMKLYPYTLKKWRDRLEVNNFNSLKPILENLLRVVSIIHDHNIVHRDLKPENILVADNGEIVLADFGISWFDPEFYERLTHTEKGDRMANFNFSAPEQFRKENQPHYTMDIFALGQIITWLITGDVVRGDRVPLTVYDTSFSLVEPVVKKMLSNSPENRPQTIKEIKDCLETVFYEQSQASKLRNKMDEVVRNLYNFDDVLRFSFPGKRGLIETEDHLKIESVINQLNKIISETALWWSQGASALHIRRKFFKINDVTWMMNNTEIQIEKMWALKDGYSLDYQFLLLKTKAMKGFGVNGTSEAAWFKDRYITRQEYDDGVAEIDGESVWLDDEVEHRVRDLQVNYYFIATNVNAVVLSKNQKTVTNIYKKLLSVGELDKIDIEQLIRLKRDRTSTMMD
ncbi:serine/threonine-protein kinase [Bacillus cereus]|uniref:serine/threonine-protein kinase n=1 Tax=Bacillus cereus TaxID=1396 RepID=UPI0025B0B86F|nr:serine/threonine-protein kinase [Bacillus cereus]WJX07552.1 serine/threonine-protein kinase [Bacillus cereus]